MCRRVRWKNRLRKYACVRKLLRRNEGRRRGLLLEKRRKLLQQKRLDKAQRLLRDTKLPVQAIAEAVGYQTTSYFYSIYKKQFGITPKECRSRLCNM